MSAPGDLPLGDDVPLSLADLRRARVVGRRRPLSAPVKTAATLFDFQVIEAGRSDSAVRETDVPSPTLVEAPSRVAHTSVAPPRALAAAVAAPALPAVWTVSALVQQVRSMVEGAYRVLSVEGEISNWRPAGSGHCYFTLKDGEAQLSAVLFRKQAALLRFRPKDGDNVRLRGQLSVYESRGQMQLIGESMEQLGLGALLQATRELKERLRREGLFERKRPLPGFPRCIGVITSGQGAALRDIVKVCRRRHAAVNLLIYPVAVQGAACAAQVEAALRWFSAHPERAEVVLLARGGGSWEDLHGFDDERVARAIVGCAVPVITGIGHATDSTIADAAADVCAPTPSAAAELLTAAQHRVEEAVARLTGRLLRAGRFELLRARQRFAGFSADGLLRRSERALERRAQRLDEASSQLRGVVLSGLLTRQLRLRSVEVRLREQSPSLQLAHLRQRTTTAAEGLRRGGESLTRARHTRLDRSAARLAALSPLRVLERGYALVYGPDGRLLRSAAEVGAGDRIVARLAEGAVRARVEPEVESPVS